MAAAAIDRIVHHSVILEFDLPGYRTNEAQEGQLQEDNYKRQLHTQGSQNNWRTSGLSLTSPQHQSAHSSNGCPRCTLSQLLAKPTQTRGPAPFPGVSANVKMGEIAKFELTYP